MNQVQRARPLLGTLTQITVRAPLAVADLHAAVDAAFADIALVHSLMSWHDADSELARVNRGATAAVQTLHPHTRAVLESALELARLSEGAFDPCVAVALTRWGLLPLPMPAAQSVVPEDAAGWRDIELSPEGVRFHRPLWLDLGGIAKGFAVDLAVARLQQCAVEDIAVNAGGDLRVAGKRAHRVAIRHPRAAHALAHELLLNNEALATSAAFESRRETAWGPVSALIDPRSGNAYCGRDSVSVRAATCMSADALTKVALFAPPDLAARVFEACAAHCIVLKADPAH
jgi:FAD:protein FMN transferase